MPDELDLSRLKKLSGDRWLSKSEILNYISKVCDEISSGRILKQLINEGYVSTRDRRVFFWKKTVKR